MSLASVLEKIESVLRGDLASEDDLKSLVESLPSITIPEWFIKILNQHRLVGVCFSLDEEDDASGMGVELKWFSPGQMIEEAVLVYPGRCVLGLGYLPVAACLEGTGDPYFIRLRNNNDDDPPLVRIPHDLVSDEETYPEEEIEIVCGSLSEFFSKAKIEN